MGSSIFIDVGSSSLTRNWTQVPCTGSSESQPLTTRRVTCLLNVHLLSYQPLLTFFLPPCLSSELPHPLASAAINLEIGARKHLVWQNSRRHYGLTLNQSLQQVWVLVMPWNVSDFPGGASGKEPTYQCRRPKRHLHLHRFDPWVGKIAWRRKWQPTPVPLPGNPMDRGAWWATVCAVKRVGHDRSYLARISKGLHQEFPETSQQSGSVLLRLHAGFHFRLCSGCQGSCSLSPPLLELGRVTPGVLGSVYPVFCSRPQRGFWCPMERIN